MLLGNHFKFAQIHLSGLKESYENPTLSPSAPGLHIFTQAASSTLSLRNCFNFIFLEARLILLYVRQFLTLPVSISYSSWFPFIITIITFNEVVNFFKCWSHLFPKEPMFLKDRRPCLFTEELFSVLKSLPAM